MFEHDVVGAARMKQLTRVDDMAPDLRECVHEFGLAIVAACLAAGVSRPRTIRQLVKEVWAGARQSSQTSDARGTLDWLLIQAGAQISAKTLYRVLAENNLVIVSAEPTRPMLNASLAEVSGFTVRCTKEEKHRRRLRAALRAAMTDMLKKGVKP